MPCNLRSRTRNALRCTDVYSACISRLPDIEGEKPKRQQFKPYPIVHFHIDIAEVQTAEGKLYHIVAIDRTSKLAFARLVVRATGAATRLLLDELVAVLPYRIHTFLTDNGIQFAVPPKKTLCSDCQMAGKCRRLLRRGT